MTFLRDRLVTLLDNLLAAIMLGGIGAVVWVSGGDQVVGDAVTNVVLDGLECREVSEGLWRCAQGR